mgnify:CR=1 FL=1
MEFQTSEIIALGSLLIAIASFAFSGWKIRAQQKQINKLDIKIKTEDIEQRRRACIRAEIKVEEYFDNKGKRMRSYSILVTNIGIATAKNIRVESVIFDNQQSGIFVRIPDGVLPYPILNHLDSFEIPISLMVGHIHVPEIAFTWDDDAGSDQKRIQVLDL